MSTMKLKPWTPSAVVAVVASLCLMVASGGCSLIETDPSLIEIEVQELEPPMLKVLDAMALEGYDVAFETAMFTQVEPSATMPATALAPLLVQLRGFSAALQERGEAPMVFGDSMVPAVLVKARVDAIITALHDALYTGRGPG